MTTSTLDLFSAFSAFARQAPAWLGSPQTRASQRMPSAEPGQMPARATVCRSLASAISPRPLTPFKSTGLGNHTGNQAAGTPIGTMGTSVANGSCGLTRSRAVRVLQVFEGAPSAAVNTRTAHIRISGRMADVCAELERLAASGSTSGSSSASAPGATLVH